MGDVAAIWISLGISMATLVLSLGITLIGAGVKWGQVQEEIRTLEVTMAKMATKEELSMIKETLAEIKGMFTLRLKD